MLIKTLFVFKRNEPEEPLSNQPKKPVQLLEKLRLIAFAENCRFPAIQSLEFQEIWPKNSLATTWMIYHANLNFDIGDFMSIRSGQTMKKNLTTGLSK